MELRRYKRVSVLLEKLIEKSQELSSMSDLEARLASESRADLERETGDLRDRVLEAEKLLSEKEAEVARVLSHLEMVRNELFKTKQENQGLKMLLREIGDKVGKGN